MVSSHYLHAFAKRHSMLLGLHHMRTTVSFYIEVSISCVECMKLIHWPLRRIPRLPSVFEGQIVWSFKDIFNNVNNCFFNKWSSQFLLTSLTTFALQLCIDQFPGVRNVCDGHNKGQRWHLVISIYDLMF